ncbi:cadherin repeat domain-containing protein [Aquimarina sp. 2201CG1-2-11]|uniref:cadherin repeat domain-containing protein n=1 Tax=Aquimarina discodermiae TaxID=3231043 RepID=UPI003462F2D0
MMHWFSIKCSNKDYDSSIDDTSTTICAIDFEVTIDKNPTKEQELGTVEAIYRLGRTIYSIITETPVDAFDVNTKTGVLTITNTTLFDFETRTSFTVTVLMKNRNNDILTSVFIANNPSLTYTQVDDPTASVLTN